MDVVSRRLILGGLLSFAASSVSTAGGLGGGGLFIPILNLAVGLDMKTSSSVSAFMVMTGSLANVMYSMRLKNPKTKNATLVDYDIVLLTEPCLLLGVSFGVICNVMFPEWLVTVLLALVLVCSTATTFKAGLRHWGEETEAAKKVEGSNGGLEKEELVEALLGDVEGRGNYEGVIFPWRKLGLLVAVWVCFFVLNVFRGEHGGKGLIHVEPCSVGYWLFTCLQLPMALTLTAYIIFSIRTSKDEDDDGQLQCMKEPRTKLLFPSVAFSAGFLGGLFGIGGGMLTNPILLQMGIHPQVTAATSSFMIFFSASMSSAQYMLIGIKHLDYALFFAAICFISSWIGLVIMQNVIDRYGRASLIIFLVAFVMSFSTVLITCFGVADFWRDYSNGRYMGFKMPC